MRKPAIAGTAKFLPTGNYVLIDRKGRIRNVYNSMPALEMEKLVQHIDLLLKEDELILSFVDNNPLFT